MTLQNWKRLGQIHAPSRRAPWMASHASYPTAFCLDDEFVRVFFSPRDGENRSHITYLDMRLVEARFEIVCEGRRPLLSPGPRGSFDDSGVTVACAVESDGGILLYYLGWSRSVTVPFRNFIGLAKGNRDGMDFIRVSPAPIIERSACDPFTLSYPWVLASGRRWRVWYGSHLEWGPSGLDMIHVIKTGTSHDGVRWTCDGEIAVNVCGAQEQAVSRPTVLRGPSGYRMWFAKRGSSYTLGYAESRDGRNWTRHDEWVGLKPSGEGWDSDDVTYPCVFVHGGRTYMLYNGNGYGRDGFGLALLDE